MDIITQGILGAAVGQAIGLRRLGRKAIFAGMIAGLIPDLDVLFKYWFAHGEMLYHRGFTHSLWFGPALGTVLGYGLARIYNQSVYTWVMVLSMGLLTHPLLDVFTVYGTQLFAPFSNQRFTIPAVPIIDLFYSVPLLMAVLYGTFFFKHRIKAECIAIIALLLTTSYVLWGYRQNIAAEFYARENLIAEGITVQKIHAFPTLLQIYLRRIVAHCQNRKGDPMIKVGYVSTWNLAQRPKIIWETKALLTDPLFTAITNHPMAKLFTWFAEEQVFLEKIQQTVVIRDVRYGFPGSPPWGIWAMVFEPAEVLNTFSNPMHWQTTFQREPLSFKWDIIRHIYQTAFTNVIPLP